MENYFQLHGSLELRYPFSRDAYRQRQNANYQRLLIVLPSEIMYTLQKLGFSDIAERFGGIATECCHDWRHTQAGVFAPEDYARDPVSMQRFANNIWGPDQRFNVERDALVAGRKLHRDGRGKRVTDPLEISVKHNLERILEFEKAVKDRWQELGMPADRNRDATAKNMADFLGLITLGHAAAHIDTDQMDATPGKRWASLLPRFGYGGYVAETRGTSTILFGEANPVPASTEAMSVMHWNQMVVPALEELKKRGITPMPPPPEAGRGRGR